MSKPAKPGSHHSTYKGVNIYRPKWPHGWWTAGLNLKADTLAGIRLLISQTT